MDVGFVDALFFGFLGALAYAFVRFILSTQEKIVFVNEVSPQEGTERACSLGGELEMVEIDTNYYEQLWSSPPDRASEEDSLAVIEARNRINSHYTAPLALEKLFKLP